MAKKKKAEPPENHERWLITYSDLITLLLIFFIIMYTMSRVDAAKYSAVANSLSLVLNGQSRSVLQNQGPALIDGLSGSYTPGNIENQIGNEEQIEEIKEEIKEYLAEQTVEETSPTGETTVKQLSEYVIIMEQERGLVISFKEAVLFTSGSDQLTSQARNIIREVGKSLLNVPNFIRVEGYTDNAPINTDKFPSNWELSVMRASSVLHVLQAESGVAPERLSAVGYGEYRPLVPNVDAVGMAMNRRVDILILREKYAYFEPGSETNPNVAATTE